jgi:hypothetical protein
MSENKVGDIVVVKTETRQEAFCRLADGTSAFLCAIAADDYENPLLREQFFVFATEIVLARIRASGGNVRLVQRDTAPPLEANANDGLPCWLCKSPIADDVRSLLRSSAADVCLTPSGVPMNCCRVSSAVGVLARTR